ncbi:hypothetical protein VKT23_005116 [Stygiomarasmius scandens]|uniref:Uncharacterized protein n=1 Tax=Marasmiellus scandens TaxID=2682957 RepID=A0ABR1JYP6_9AGAR
MLVVLTLKKAYETRRELKEEGMLVPSILVLVVRDGSIYFAVMAVANFLNILTFYLTGPYMRGGLSTFASAVSVTMMSRLMLNLHEVAETGLYTSHRETCQFGTQSGILTHLTDESDDYFTYRYNKQTAHHLQA